jgi:hypothetical protein
MQMYFNGQLDKFGRPVIYMKPVRDTSNDRVIKVRTRPLTLASSVPVCHSGSHA